MTEQATMIERARSFVSGPIARGSIASVTIRISGLGLSFVQAVIVARILGAEQYGLLAVAISVAQIGAAITVFGYGSLAVREVSGWLSTKRTYLIRPFLKYTLTRIVAVSIIAAWLVAASGMIWIDYQPYLLIGSAIIPALALIQFMRGASQGFGDVVGAQWPGELLRPILVIALIIVGIFLVTKLDATHVLIVFVIASLTAATAASLVLLRNLARHKAVASKDAQNHTWYKQATPFLGLALLAIVQSEMATLMLAFLTTPEQAGLYQPIARLTPVIALPVTAAAMRFTPRVAELWASGQKKRLVSITRIFTLATTALTACVAIALAAAGPWILQLYGAEFTVVAPLLWIVGGAQVIHAACGPVGILLTMSGHTRSATTNLTVGVMTAALGCLLLVPEYGTMGAAIAMSISVVLWNLISVVSVKRRVGINPTILQFSRNNDQTQA